MTTYENMQVGIYKGSLLRAVGAGSRGSRALIHMDNWRKQAILAAVIGEILGGIIHRSFVMISSILTFLLPA